MVKFENLERPPFSVQKQMDQPAMVVRKVVVQIQMTNAKQMEPARFVRLHLHFHTPAALS